jgi:hypothetical protein
VIDGRATTRSHPIRQHAAVTDPSAARWSGVDRQERAGWPVRTGADGLPRRPWNRTAILSPFVALVCAPAGLCLGLVAAGRIGLGRQRGIGFAVAGIVIGALVPVVVCVGSIVR